MFARGLGFTSSSILYQHRHDLTQLDGLPMPLQFARKIVHTGDNTTDVEDGANADHNTTNNETGTTNAENDNDHGVGDEGIEAGVRDNGTETSARAGLNTTDADNDQNLARGTIESSHSEK